MFAVSVVLIFLWEVSNSAVLGGNFGKPTHAAGVSSLRAARQRMGRWAVKPVCSSLGPLRAHRQVLGLVAKLSREGRLILHSPRVRSGRIHDLSCFSHPITHCATFTYLGQGWMKGLLNKWGRGGRARAASCRTAHLSTWTHSFIPPLPPSRPGGGAQGARSEPQRCLSDRPD